MNKHHVLLLEDDANLGLILKEHLLLNGFEVTLCTDGVEGLTQFEPGRFDLCLVDIMMPRKDGFTFAEEVRSVDKTTPLIFLTAKSMTEDKIKGFKIGCDDYLTKPFSVEELLLRIQAVLKRSGGEVDDAIPDVFELGTYRFDYQRQQLSRDGSETRLTSKESDLLRLLCLNKNRILERETALRHIWNDESYFAGRSMDVFISKLRKLLKDDPKIEIVGVHGKGFRLVVD